MVASGTLVCGCFLWALFIDGNLIGSLMKNTGRSLNTKSWLPSSVKILIAKPRMSRRVSLAPFSPATVETRARTGVFLPTPVRKLHEVMSEMSCVTSYSPHAPAAFEWTARSGIRSRGKCARASMSAVSSSKLRPPLRRLCVPRRMIELVGSANGRPRHGVR